MNDSPRIPVLLDTDIGSDIDDAIALAYLLGQERCELVGVTTVSGEVDQRAACADAVCLAAGRPEIPIYTGLSEPLGPGPGQPHVPHYGAIAGRVKDRTYEPGAVDFMREMIHSRPGEIVLLSIGPFTSIAALFAIDPEIPGLLGGYVSMGGTFPDAPVPDWNPLVDPVAACIAYHLAPAGHVSIGLDVTRQCRISAEQARADFDSRELFPVLEMAEVWLEEHDEITLHDPLAAAVIFAPDLCTYATGDVRVVL
ncbi:MAG TPA: nucleoside hydrolase, partial [Chloroflexota bacterium]|nr:nucleoside hydrolase [Chloroflexota bacterium]